MNEFMNEFMNEAEPEEIEKLSHLKHFFFISGKNSTTCSPGPWEEGQVVSSRL